MTTFSSLNFAYFFFSPFFPFMFVSSLSPSSNEDGDGIKIKEEDNQHLKAAATSKKSPLDTLRSQQRARTRSDDFGGEDGKFRPEGQLHTIVQNVATLAPAPYSGSGRRRWSESGAVSGDTISSGSLVRVLVDFRPTKADEINVSKGQMVRVSDADGDRVRIVVQHGGAKDAAGWVPAYVINLLSGKKSSTSSSSSLAAGLRKLRRPSFGKKDSKAEVANAAEEDNTCVASAGETAVLKCARSPSAISVRWYRVRRRPAGGARASSVAAAVETATPIQPGGPRHSFEHGEHQGVAVMYVAGCGAADDSGEYRCVQRLADGSEAVFTLRLIVKGKK